jgi:hypothetical protein
MTKCVHDGSAIECLSAEIVARKIVVSSFMEIRNIGRCFTYKCSRNGEAVVTKELNPKEARYNLNSNLNLNDKVEGENLFLAINDKRGLRITKTNHTGTHKAQLFNTKEYTYAEVSRQIPNIPLLIPPLVFKPVPLLDKP